MMHCGGVAGDAQLAGEVTPLDPRSVGKVVRYGTKSGVYTASLRWGDLSSTRRFTTTMGFSTTRPASFTMSDLQVISGKQP